MSKPTFWNRLTQLLGSASNSSTNSGTHSHAHARSGFHANSRLNSSLRSRELHMEELESRQLLSVTAADFSAISAQYAELNLGQTVEDWNVIEIDAAGLSSDALGQAIQNAVQTAEQTTADDLVVVRTTEQARTAYFGEGSLVVNLDSDAYGSLAVVGWGDAMLRLVGTTQTVADVQAGNVGFGGVTFFGLEQASGSSLSTRELLAEADSASVALSRTLMATGDGSGLGETMETLAESLPGSANSNSTVTTINHVSDSFYSLELCLEDTTWAYITGLSSDDVTLVEENLTGESGQVLFGDFIDAEKTSGNTNETEMCWAAAAANVLWYTGWANSYVAQDDDGNALFYDEQSVFAHYVDSFTNAGNNAEYAFTWFLDGEYAPQGAAGYSQMREEGSGGYYPGISFDDVGVSLSMESKTNIAQTLTNMGIFAESMRDGGGAVVSLGWYNSSNSRVGGHSVTTWGYMYDASKEGNFNYYTGIFVTNSDDSMSTPSVNSLKTVKLTWNADLKRYKMVNFSTSTAYDGYIEELICLQNYEPSMDLKFEKAGTLSQINALPGTALTLNDLSVINIGTEASKDFTVKIYASLDETIGSSDDILLATLDGTSITNTESFSETNITLNTSKLTEGKKYTIGAVISTSLEADSTNNTAIAGTLETVAGMYTSGTEATLDSDSIVIGKKFSIENILVSNPLSTASGQYTLEFYAREDDNLSSDELIATVVYDSIPTGESVYVSSGELSTANMVANTNYVLSWKLVNAAGEVVSTSSLSSSVPAILTPFTSEEYAQILERYPNLSLPEMTGEELPSNLHISVFELNDASTVSLLETAMLNMLYYSGDGDKLLVIRVTEEFNTLTLTESDEALDFDFDAGDGTLTLAVLGPNGQKLTLDAASRSRVLTVSRGDVRIGGFVFTGGVNANDAATACGAGVYNVDHLTLDGCEVTGNLVSTTASNLYTAGAGIFSSGTTNLYNCDIHDNSSDSDGSYGLGVYNNNGTMLISGCRIYNQKQTTQTGLLYGGGVYSTGTTTIESSDFYGNTAQGGAAVLNFGEMTVKGSCFHNNAATVSSGSYSYGGAIYTQKTLTIDSSTFYSNTATHGAAICSVEGDVTPFISNSLFYNNAASLYGGALFMVNLTATNNTFVNNTAQYGSALFADRYSCESTCSGYCGGFLTLNNNLLAGNQSTEGADVFNNYEMSTIFGRNNIASFTEWTAGDGTGGNLTYDPEATLFVDAKNHDYHLLADAVAVDAGHTASAVDASGAVLKTDLDGNTRIYNSTVDIGAYEYSKPTFEIKLTGYTGTYNGLAQGQILVSGLQAGDSVAYSTDGENYSTTMPTRTDAGTTTVFVRVQRDGYETWFGSADIVIQAIEVSLQWNTAESYIYNGQEQTVTATYVDYFGQTQQAELAFSGADSVFVNAGDYVVTALSEGTNYTFAMDTSSVELSIQKLDLTVRIASTTLMYGEALKFDLDYDGFIEGEDSSVLSGTVKYVGYQLYDDIGTYSITASGLSATNYTIHYESSDVEITARELTVSISTLTARTYNGKTDATGTYAISGIVNDDAVTLAGGVFTYADPNVGSAKTVTLSDYTLTGDKMGNYVLVNDTATSAKGRIIAAPLIVTANDSTISYGSAAKYNGYSVTGLIDGELEEDVLNGTASYTSNYRKGSSSLGRVGRYTITVSGLLAKNYSISYRTGTLTVVAKVIDTPSFSFGGVREESINISIGSVSNAKAYVVQYSKDSSFATYETLEYSSYGTKVVDGLVDGTTYYFRVYAVAKNTSTIYKNYADSAMSEVYSNTTLARSYDLQTTNDCTLAENTTIRGTKLGISDVVISNMGVDISRAYSVRFYISDSAEFDVETATLVQTVSQSALQAGSSTSISTTLDTQSFVPGTYYISWFVDIDNDGDVTNNLGSCTTPLQITSNVFANVQTEAQNSDQTWLPNELTYVNEWDTLWVGLWMHDVMDTTFTFAYDATNYTLDTASDIIVKGVLLLPQATRLNETTGLTEIDYTVTIGREYTHTDSDGLLIQKCLRPTTPGTIAAGSTPVANWLNVDETFVNTQITAVSYDLDDNGVVNLNDLLEFARYYSAETRFNTAAKPSDFDQNGVVNMADLLQLAKNFSVDFDHADQLTIEYASKSITTGTGDGDATIPAGSSTTTAATLAGSSAATPVTTSAATLKALTTGQTLETPSVVPFESVALDDYDDLPELLVNLQTAATSDDTEALWASWGLEEGEETSDEDADSELFSELSLAVNKRQ